MSIKCVVSTAIFAGVMLSNAALAETIWAPPAEIAPKAAPQSQAAPAADTKGAGAKAGAPVKAADKEKDCKAQADTKGLHGKARKKFHADCVKG